MKLSSNIVFLLQLTAASAATTKVLRTVERTRSLSSSFNKQQEYLAKLPASLAENGNAVAAARHGSDVSVQCFTDTSIDYGFMIDITEEGDPVCTPEGSFISCDYGSTGLPACTEAGGTIVRETTNYCEEGFIATNVPFCVAPSCDDDVTYTDIMVDFALPVSFVLFGGEEVFMLTLEEYIHISGFGSCDVTTPSSKAPKSSKNPKSSKSPSSKAPKSSKSPSSKAPKSTKTPKATSAPSSKAPKASTKSPKSTKAPGAVAGAASSAATASMSAASVAAGALVWFSL